MRATFVHLGSKIPDHLYANLLFIKSNFPNIETVLIVDEYANHDIDSELVNLHYVYRRNDLVIQNLLARSKNDLDFRNAFWKSSIERIFALIEFSEYEIEDVPLLHIESDVVILPNFPWNKISNFQGGLLGWLPYSLTEDVAALLYIKSKSAANELRESLVKILTRNPSITDMMALREAFDMLYPRSFYFPILWPGSVNEPIVSDAQGIALRASLNSRYFEGVFDSLAIGMYFTGIDPRNNYGMHIIHDEKQAEAASAIINPKGIELKIDENNRLFLLNSEFETPIFNLHIHSKRMKLFGEGWASELRRLLALSKKKRLEGFSIKIFAQQVKENFDKKTLIRYLLGPMLRKQRLIFRFMLDKNQLSHKKSHKRLY